MRVRLNEEPRMLDVYIYLPRETSNGAYSLVVFADSALKVIKHRNGAGHRELQKD